MSDFPDAEIFDELGKNQLNFRAVIVLCNELECFGEKVIADENRDLCAVFGVGSSDAASFLGGVDNVVVNEASRVNQFESNRKRHRSFGRTICFGIRAQQEEHRAQSFSAFEQRLASLEDKFVFFNRLSNLLFQCL